MIDRSPETQKSLFVGPANKPGKPYQLFYRDNPFSMDDMPLKKLTYKQAREMWISGVLDGLYGDCWELDGADDD
jgi:hypothetical protein